MAGFQDRDESFQKKNRQTLINETKIIIKIIYDLKEKTVNGKLPCKNQDLARKVKQTRHCCFQGFCTISTLIFTLIIILKIGLYQEKDT